MVSGVIELDDKSLHQEISYKQQIMAWSRAKYNVSGRRILKSAT
jgi:hypothetical protein